MSDGGKGSAPRPYSVTQDEFASNWDRIFKKSNYQDILSTEDCVLSALETHENDNNSSISDNH